MDDDTVWDRRVDEPEEVGPEGWVDESEDLTPDDLPPSPELINLLNLGELKARLDVRGYEVWIKTLKVSEELEIGLLIQPYVNTIEEGRALATATVAAAIESIDGRELVGEIGPDGRDLLKKKFDYVRTRMYWPVIKILYEEGYIPLVQQQVDAIKEFRKK